MFQSQVSRKLLLAFLAAGLVGLAGCSSHPETTATDQPPRATHVKRAAAPAPKPKAEGPKVVPVSAKATQPSGRVITVPKGTPITAIVDQTLEGDKNHKGDTFVASLSSPVRIDGKTVLPKGAHITGKVVTAKKHELKVALASVVIHGKSYDLETNSLRPSDKIKTASAKSKEKANQKIDNSKLAVNSQLTFKLSKPVTVPAKGYRQLLVAQSVSTLSLPAQAGKLDLSRRGLSGVPFGEAVPVRRGVGEEAGAPTQTPGRSGEAELHP